MKREEAIKIIKECKEKKFKYTFYTLNEYHAALDMAIEALMREDTFLNKVLAIIEDYDLYKADEDGDIVACRSEILGEIEHLKGGEYE